MLKEIYIENLAVIEKVSVAFSDKLNVFTGETGAGKSILINGINAILGQRVTKDIVRTGCKKACISGLFINISDIVKNKLDELGLSYEDNEITVEREIFADGGSVARVNSRAISISVLREIGENLIVIHGQHDNQILMSPEKHINILDGFGNIDENLREYRKNFKKLQQMAKKLGNIKKNYIEKQGLISSLKNIVMDMGELNLCSGEYEELEEEYKTIINFEKISNTLQMVSSLLENEDNNNIIDMLSSGEKYLDAINDLSVDVMTLAERLSAAKIELEDINNELVQILDSMEVDFEKSEQIINRYTVINKLMKKYNCDFDGLIEKYNNAQENLKTLECSDDEINRLNAEKKELLLAVTENAKIISISRENVGKRFIKAVSNELSFLDMPNVIINIKQDRGKLTVNGMDSIEFLISANKGEEAKPIAKIASGGELSRIMLALKSVIAENDSMQSMIFDEIDTGVSGIAAQKIGIKLKQLSEIRQILCVTHLSQIAVMADNHILIEKSTVDDRTLTNVKVLDFNGRIKEIARIMGGENPSDLMLKNAEEELKRAVN